MAGMFTSTRWLAMLPIAGVCARSAQVRMAPGDIPLKAFGHSLAFLNAGPNLSGRKTSPTLTNMFSSKG